MLTPVTVFTGYLGSGKTTIIINLVRQLDPDYKVVLLKNEFGNVQVDSEIAKENNIEVKEIINGCLCCVLVGKLQYALLEIVDKYHPDRIIIETSGSAYPAPIAWEIRKLSDKLRLDAIITVIDAVNFKGYKDKSYTAKLQAEYTDLILINKHELVDEQKLDKTLDDVYELNPTTPKIKTVKGSISPDLIFGIDTKLFSEHKLVIEQEKQADRHHHRKEVELAEAYESGIYKLQDIEQLLQNLPKWDFYRIKGVVNTEEGAILINYVFGRYDFTKLEGYRGETKIVFMGKNLKLYLETLAKLFVSVAITEQLQGHE